MINTKTVGNNGESLWKPNFLNRGRQDLGSETEALLERDPEELGSSSNSWIPNRFRNAYSALSTELNSIPHSQPGRAQLKEDSDLEPYVENWLAPDYRSHLLDLEVTQGEVMNELRNRGNYTNPDRWLSDLELLDARKVWDFETHRDYKTFALAEHEEIDSTVNLQNGITSDPYKTKTPVLVEIDHYSDEVSLETYEPDMAETDLGLEYTKSVPGRTAS